MFHHICINENKNINTSSKEFESLLNKWSSIVKTQGATYELMEYSLTDAVNKALNGDVSQLSNIHKTVSQGRSVGQLSIVKYDLDINGITDPKVKLTVE